MSYFPNNDIPKALLQALKYILTMKGLRPMTKMIIIVALIGLMAVGLTCPTAKAQEEGKNYAVSGVLINNGKPYGVFGYAYRSSERLSYFVQSEIGGDEQAFGATPILTFGLSTTITLGALIGPQVEIISENPTTKETISYLGATTGVIGILQFNERAAIWAGIRYLMIDADVKPFKIGVGLILDLE